MLYKFSHSFNLAKRRWMLLLVVFLGLVALFPSLVLADPYPPFWLGGGGPAVHIQPAAWPSEPANPLDCGDNCGGWKPYTRFRSSINDPRTQDPSNGGARPQNYVNISSSCIDQSQPSIYYYTDTVNNVVMFRWRVEQIANTYATGPAPKPYGNTDPWNAALWTVFFDVDGDGYRDFAAHLNGSSGDPTTQVDRLVGIWGDVPNNQSLDYPNDPNIHILGHNPTGFVDQASSFILNFHSNLTPDISWPNGAGETVWDYGSTRSKVITKSNVDGASCTEYFVDYQIPLSILDASPVGGPTLDADTTLSMLFCTANSLNNPFQKDCALSEPWVADPNKPAPFGDFLTLNAGLIDQPIVDLIVTQSCGPVNLTANVKDTLKMISGDTATSITDVDFYYYYDANGDQVANDGSAWTLAASGTNSNLKNWTGSWDNTTALAGQYLLGVQALDNGSLNVDGKANRTFSYLSQAEVDALGNNPTISGENWYANPLVTGAVSTVLDLNSCGLPPPYVTKSVSPSETSAGSPVQFTVTVHNNLSSAITVSTITDTLPVGFTFVSTDGGTLGTPTTGPTGGASGTATWTFPAVTVPASGSRTLIFTANVSTIVGTYANLAIAGTSYGQLTSDPVQIGVGAPRLTISKAANTASAAPGEVITYTITYANDSTVNVTNGVITDVVSAGLINIVPLDGGINNSGTITWSVGSIAAGDGPFSVRFQATVVNPYPDADPIPLVNTATIDSTETDPASASVATFVTAPRPNLTIQKSADLLQMAAGGDVIFTINYRNVGNSTATSVVITDVIPTGFTYQASFPTAGTNPGVNNNGTVAWSIGSVAAGDSGSVTLTLKADTPYTASNPATNTTTIDSTQTNPVSASASVGITQVGQVCTNLYFKNTMASVGFDGSQRIANTTAPTSGTDSTINVLADTGAFTEIARFYSDPESQNVITFSGPISTTIYITKNDNRKSDVRITVYDYNPSTGSKTQIGQQTFTDITAKSGNLYEFAVTGSGTLTKNHRLMWLVEAKSNNPAQQASFTVRFDSTSSPSGGQYCVTAPGNLVMEKTASAGTISAGSTLSYTIQFANIGSTSVTGAVVTDTLPTGVTYASASLNGSVTTPASINGQTYTFNVRSSDTATSGQVTAGQTGTLIVTTTVNAPLSPAIITLLNTAQMESTQTGIISDTTTTAILSPVLSINKAIDKSLLIPGEVVTYTVTILNSGTAAATNVTISDTLPAQSYFTYVANSTKLDGITASPDPVSGNLMTYNIGSLAAGASAAVTLRMQMATNGVPQGVVTLDNRAAVTSTQTSQLTSNTVTVAISTNPNLSVTKSAVPSGPLTPGDLVTYTLTVRNVGSNDAADVQVFDPIPANVGYVAGTLVYEGAPRTDATDGDNGRFDPGTNRAIFAVGTLSSSQSRSIEFTVRVKTPLPSGTTDIANLATASSSNTSSKQATATVQATASPVLTIDKSGPASVAYPAAILTAAATSTTTLHVSDTTQFNVGQYILISAQQRQVTAVDLTSGTITVSSNVTAAQNNPVIIGLTYSIAYQNSGNADATNAVITDTLPGSTTYITSTNGGVYNSGVVTWSLGTLSAGSSGSVQVTVYPGGTGTLTNLATLDSTETTPISDSVVTQVGGLRVYKRTTTPTVQQTKTGATATYAIEVQNTLGSAATGVIITDTLASGFTFASTTAISGGTRSPSTPNPTGGEEQPAWGTFSIAGNSSVVISFTVDISSTVGQATYQNFVNLTSTDTSVVQFDPLNTTDEDVTVLIPIIRLAKTVIPSAANVGQPVTYTITAENIGDAVATGLVISDALPSDFSLLNTVSTAVSNGSRTTTNDPLASATQPEWSAWTVSPGGVVTITFRVDTGTATGTFSNTVHADSASTLLPSLNNTAPVTLTSSGLGTVFGHLFQDTNGNGSQDSGEPNLNGISVVITDSLGITQTLTSDSSGNYTATVPAGNTTADVDETTLPAGVTQTAGSDPTTVNISADRHTDSDADRHCDTCEHRHADGHTDSDADRHGHACEHRHADSHTDSNADRHCDTCGHRHADGHTDSDADRHCHTCGHRNADGHTDGDADRHCDTC